MLRDLLAAGHDLGNALVPDREGTLEGLRPEQTARCRVDQVQGHASLQYSRHVMKQEDLVAVAARGRERSDDRIRRALQDRLRNVPPFEPPLLDVRQLAHEYSVPSTSDSIHCS
jgi:hypothetical protein